jgi:hypothetical protein
VLTGSVQFLSQGSANTAAEPVVVATSEGSSASSFNYTIPAHSVFRLRTAATAASVRVGSVRVVPAANSGTPSGVSIFSFRNAGVTVTEAGVPAIAVASAFRLYAESSGNFAQFQAGSIQTGIAITNSLTTATTVNFQLTHLDGTPTGLTGTVSVPANGQTALFLNQAPGFAAMPATFQGVLRISAIAGISVVGLRGRYNERGDFLITTTPPIAEDSPASQAEMLFPHIVEGAGYTTQFILFSGSPGQASSGTLRFLSQAGQPLVLDVR